MHRNKTESSLHALQHHRPHDLHGEYAVRRGSAVSCQAVNYYLPTNHRKAYMPAVSGKQKKGVQRPSRSKCKRLFGLMYDDFSK